MPWLAVRCRHDVSRQRAAWWAAVEHAVGGGVEGVRRGAGHAPGALFLAAGWSGYGGIAPYIAATLLGGPSRKLV